MMSKELKEKVNEIEMPDNMRARIIKNCYSKLEEETMKEHKRNSLFRRPMVAVATLALCICVTGISAMAATGKLQGFFKDITRWDGAVVGTSYEQATEEMQVNATETSEGLEIEVTFLTPDQAPYLYFEQFGIQTCEIVDSDGKVMVKEITSELAEVQDGKVNILLTLEELPKGSYKLRISEMVGAKKADQPLVLHGAWECEFAR